MRGVPDRTGRAWVNQGTVSTSELYLSWCYRYRYHYQEVCGTDGRYEDTVLCCAV